MQINALISALLNYGEEKNLFDKRDRNYTVNRLLEILNLDEYEQVSTESLELCDILKEMCDYAVEKQMIEDTVNSRDLFDTKIMGALIGRPNEVIGKFNELYDESPKKATEYFYNLSKDSNYIRIDRIVKDKRWTVETKYGTLDISINLSKPEKDPKDIAAAKNAKQSGYPKCQLCKESEGYAGRINYPARQNHRIIPITINNSQWGFQYSPYVYYNEHCIAFNFEHIPMKINRDTFVKLFDFTEVFPHYFIGSNADLPIVGGSILSHDHFQGGNYEFAMERAKIEKNIVFSGYEDIGAGIVKWPLSVIRLNGEDRNRIIDLADKILNAWREYSDDEWFVFAETDGEKHNTITPIARRKGKNYELDLVLRNNITTNEHPLGVYHPHEQYHNIKKENIGLIEVMGLAVLPARLKKELELVEDVLVNNKDIQSIAELEKHREWIFQIKGKYNGKISKDNVSDIIEKEVGIVFEKVLECAGVYKCTEQGRKGFDKFISYVNQN